MRGTKTVAIIGGGPAGAVAAERLARGGYRATVFEDRLGWEKPCGGGVTPRALRDFPFLADALDSARAVREVEFIGPRGASFRFSLSKPLLIFSRAGLNRLLLERAIAAGAEVIPDRIAEFRRGMNGWELCGRSGSYRGDFLVIAAGARTRLRSRLAEDFAAEDFMLTFGYHLPGSESLLRVQFFEDFEGYAWSFPRPDHVSVGICGKMSGSNMAGLKQRLRVFMERFGFQPDSARVYSHLLPSLEAESWGSLRLAGPDWALAGDAAGLVDPLTGEGIYFAMRSGGLLAQAILAGEPVQYPRQVWSEFGRALALGASISRHFYRGTICGDAITNRLVEMGAGSRRFANVLRDLIEGRQSYPGLALRLYLMLAAIVAARAVESFRNSVREAHPAGL